MEEEETEGRRSGALAFAEKQLRRHGWKKGKGLGKRENGISDAIRVKVKCDTAGVGHNSAEQFTFHWWDHLFNSSAASIATVQAGKDGVKVQKVSAQEGSVSNKKPRKAHGEKDMLYGRFVKAAILMSGREEPSNPLPSSDSSDEDEKLDLSTVRRLTDEELLKACGGRTAHKGARHGLTMSAKLARLEEQEKAFLAGRLQPKAAQKEAESASEGPKSKKDKKKKKARRPKEGEAEEAVSSEGLEAMGGEEERPKRKKKEKKRKREEEENAGEELWTQTMERKEGRKKAKRKKE